MSSRLILCEGVDDLAALREVIARDCRRTGAGRSDRFRKGDIRSFQFLDGDRPPVHLVSVDGKGKFPERLSFFIANPSLDDPFDVIGVCFDPDSQTKMQASAWIRKKCIPQGAETSKTEHGFRVTLDERVTEVVPLPWCLGEVFDQLEDERNIERVALSILQDGAESESKLIDELLTHLRENQVETSWKTAIKLWNAVRLPASDGPGFLAQVFGQDDCLRASKNSLLEGTPLLASLKYICGV